MKEPETMSTNLDALVAAAKDRAAEVQTGTALAPLPNLTANLPAAASSGYNMTVDSFLQPSGLSCDSYIQVKEGGIKLSKDWAGFIDEFEATLDPRDVAFFMGIRREIGKQVDYAKTYDGVSTPRGEVFADVVREFKATSQKAAETYRGADVPLTLTQAYEDPRDKKKSFEAGTVVGWTTSITAFKPFQQFMRKLQSAGLMETPVKIKLSFAPRVNAAGQSYGVLDIDVIGVLEDA